MIQPATEIEQFLEICNRLHQVPRLRISEQGLLQLLLGTGYRQDAEAWASWDQGQMTGCLVLHHGGDLSGVPVLYVVFLWLDPRCPELHRLYLELVDRRAEETGAARISMATVRSARAIERKYGRYGYRSTHTIIEKEVR